LKSNQKIIELQHENKQYFNQIETYRSTLGKLQFELDEKQNVKSKTFPLILFEFQFFQFVDQVQSDLTERSALHVNLNNQLSQENKSRMSKISELEQALIHEQQRVRISC
jgi:hypothetical protein